MKEKVRLSTVGMGKVLLVEYLCAANDPALLLPTLLCAAAKFNIYEGRFGVMKGPLEVYEFIQPPLSLKPLLSGGGNCRRPVLPSARLGIWPAPRELMSCYWKRAMPMLFYY